MSFTANQKEIIQKIAIAAHRQPILSSGLWFHHDLRDNFYYASYLFAAAVDQSEPLPFERESAKQTAVTVLLEVLALQDQDAQSVTYGHWPLWLELVPKDSKPNTLPVELMGSLMAFFAGRYRTYFDEKLIQAFDAALIHIYRSGFYHQKNVFGHHDAKYTAAKLIFGQMFDDAELLEDGRNNLQLTLAHIRKHGMSEYSSMPWFWHWVQAFTCAWHEISDAAIKRELADMLDFLWNERAVFYLKGAWVGAHCRGQKHDIPLDSNVLHDYVQFGDFELPEQMPRTEYAGFLYYEAPETARRTALNRNEPTEVNKVITKLTDGGVSTLHSYAYITSDFASGGMWERFKEFDNEQHRWDISLPLGQQSGVNQLYFFHPAESNAVDDLRHQTEHTEVLYYKNTIMALYPIPTGIDNTIVGVLPCIEWQQEPGMLLGQTGHVYLALYLMQPYELDRRSDRHIVTSEGSENGVIVEAISYSDALKRGISSYAEFVEEAKRNMPTWSTDKKLSVRYVSQDKSVLELNVDRQGKSEKWINGLSIDFTEYKI
ncbi:hypothetical protein [Bacillus sp. FJAT-28004]|uniref:hypothetical protein n=1 Tax=Bacillus sp. FJAT-28004 TaxID=1679165 RepID=UPI0006B53FD2|nr:hypothetical protein [Bacillus sp. FJAT-28004]